MQNVQVRLNDNASDELKFRIQRYLIVQHVAQISPHLLLCSLGNDLSSIFGALSQYSMYVNYTIVSNLVSSTVLWNKPN